MQRFLEQHAGFVLSTEFCGKRAWEDGQTGSAVQPVAEKALPFWSASCTNWHQNLLPAINKYLCPSRKTITPSAVPKNDRGTLEKQPVFLTLWNRVKRSPVHVLQRTHICPTCMHIHLFARNSRQAFALRMKLETSPGIIVRFKQHVLLFLCPTPTRELLKHFY